MMGAYLAPTKAMMCSAKFRNDNNDPEASWSQITKCSNENKWFAFVNSKYQERANAWRDYIKTMPPMTSEEKKKTETSVMPLTQVSDVGLKAWTYLRQYARNDTSTAFYVTEIYDALDATERDRHDPNYVITEKRLGLV